MTFYYLIKSFIRVPAC